MKPLDKFSAPWLLEIHIFTFSLLKFYGRPNLISSIQTNFKYKSYKTWIVSLNPDLSVIEIKYVFIKKWLIFNFVGTSLDVKLIVENFEL